MKKETILTAVVFLSIGFLAGYVFEADRATLAPAATPDAPQPAAGPAASAAAPAGAPELPPGHPPIENSAMVETLTKLARENPKDPHPPLELGNYYFDQRQFSQAVEWYQKALALDPANANARTDLGTCYFDLGDSDKALAEFRQALEADPDHKPTLFNMIVVNLEGKHDLAAAQKAWNQLQRLDPTYKGLDELKRDLETARAAGGKPRATLASPAPH